MHDQVSNVLFVCTDNSAASIIAESILKSVGKSRFHAFSAGMRPAKTVNGAVVEFLRRREMPVDGLRAKSWREFAAPQAPKLDFVISVTDRVPAEELPAWASESVVARWYVEDPIGCPDAASADRAIRDAFWVLMRRIKIFVSLPHGRVARHSIQRRLQAIEFWQ